MTKNLGFLRNSEDSWYPQGRGIILVSHDIKSIDRFCSRIMVFKDGKLIEKGCQLVTKLMVVIRRLFRRGGQAQCTLPVLWSAMPLW